MQTSSKSCIDARIPCCCLGKKSLLEIKRLWQRQNLDRGYKKHLLQPFIGTGIDQDRLPGDTRCALRGQPHDGIGYLFGFSQAF